MAPKDKPLLYDCNKCPAYCCSYDRIEVTDFDLERLAEHLGLSMEDTEKRYTKMWEEDERVLRHRNDDIYGTVCRFLDKKTRRCTVYEGRPEVCREYPDRRRCGYYEFLKWERNFQDDDEFIPLYD